MPILGFHHAAVIVSDVKRSIEFYRDVVGMQLLFTTEGSGDEFSRGVGVPCAEMQGAFMQLGNGTLEIINYVTPKGRPYDRKNNDLGVIHLCFTVTDIQREYECLSNNGVSFNTAPNMITDGPMKGGKWCYFTGPDGEKLELVEL